jgi:hypothetical protein
MIGNVIHLKKEKVLLNVLVVERTFIRAILITTSRESITVPNVPRNGSMIRKAR